MTTQQHLTQLESTGLLRLAQTHPELEYLFRHALVQDAAYESLLMADRQKLHRQVGETIERLFPDRLEELASLLGQHFAKAGETEKAITYLLQAGDRARGLYAHPEAIGFYRQALALLHETGDTERTAATLMKLGLTYHNAFDFEQSRLAYEEAFALRQQAEQPHLTVPLTTHILRVPSPTIPTLDPTKIGDTFGTRVAFQLFSGLVMGTPEGMVAPDVARQWEISNDGRRYVFHLRDDVFWSDGVRVTAADFVFAWQRVLTPQTNSRYANLLYDIKGAEDFHRGHTTNPNTVGVFARDEMTLVVELKQPASYFLQLLTSRIASPVPRHVIASYGEQWTEAGKMVTNGPFKLEAGRIDEKLTLVRNPTYHGAITGNVQQIEISISMDYSAVPEHYHTDQLDIVFGVGSLSPSEREDFWGRHPADYSQRPSLNTYSVEFNLKKCPFNDVRVRQALAMAMDKQQLPGVSTGQDAPATGGYMPPGMPGHSAGIGLPFDPERARCLLAEAGYPDGRGFPVVTWLTGWGQTEFCQNLVYQWHKNLGINLQWEGVPWSEYFATLKRVQPHLFMAGWVADYPDPDNFLRVAISPRSRWPNKTYIELVEQARTLLDHTARMKLYAEADRLLVEQAVIIPYRHGKRHVLAKPWLKNVRFSATGHPFWKDVIIEPH